MATMWGIQKRQVLMCLIVSSRVRHEIVTLFHKQPQMSRVPLQNCYDRGRFLSMSGGGLFARQAAEFHLVFACKDGGHHLDNPGGCQTGR